MTDSRIALERLTQSEQVWSQAWRTEADFRPWQLAPTDGVPRYTYVRAHAESDEEVRFTLLSVEAGRVNGRILFAAHPAELDAEYPGAEVLKTLWAEPEGSVGEHLGAFAPLTIDALYATCRNVLSGVSHENPAQLYFHPNGILMHCASAGRDSDSVSIQSFSRYGLDVTSPDRGERGHLVCVDQRGVFAPFAENPLTDNVCLPWTPEERVPRRTKAERDAQCPYPGSCPEPGPARPAYWQVPIGPCHTAPKRAPEFLEIGKSEPRAAWSFPFRIGASIECEREERVYLRRVDPLGEPRSR